VPLMQSDTEVVDVYVRCLSTQGCVQSTTVKFMISCPLPSLFWFDAEPVGGVDRLPIVDAR